MRKAAIIAAMILVIAAGPAFPAFVAAESVDRDIPLAKDVGQQLSLEEMGEIYAGDPSGSNTGNGSAQNTGTINGNANNGVGSIQCNNTSTGNCVGPNANVGINSVQFNGNALAGASALVMMAGVNSSATVQMNVVVIKDSIISGSTFSGTNNIVP